MVTTTSAASRSDLDLCLLGPLTVSIDGRQVTLGGPRQMAVLARLMVTPGQVVSMEQLISSVWDGGEPSRPHVTVRSYVSNLRRAIEPNRRRRAADSRLSSSPPGYRLAVDPSDVDWVRFQRLIDSARVRASDGDSDLAVTLLRRALSLWRGEPCSGLPASDVFEAHRLRLAGLRQTAVGLLYESLLQGGQHDAVAAEIESAIVADPLRERLTELGMLAFYRSGRQSDALALGRRLRNRLREDLGIDPSTAISDTELRILNHDPSLDHAALPAARPHLGFGSPPAVAKGTGVGDDVPGGPAPLVGRAEIRQRLVAVDSAVAGGRMGAAAIVGEQGIGKTAIVRDLTDRLSGAGVEVVWGRSLADGSTQLWPWAQIVVALLERELIDEPVPGSPTAELAALGGLGRSVAAMVGAEAGAGASTATPDIMLAVTGLLRRRARRSPIALVLEDLHWADRSTVTLLEYAVLALVDVPVAFIATWRQLETEGGALAVGLRSLSRLPDVIRVDLEPMDEADVGDLVAVAGRALSPQEAAALCHRSGGNPLFVDELLTAPPGGAGVDPPSAALVAIVIDRVGRIHPLAIAVLRTAALFRGPFAAEDLGALHPAGRAAVDRVLAAAIRSQLIEQAEPSLGTFRFRHPIVGEVLEVDAAPNELRACHQSIGHHLLDVDEVEACYHLTWSPDPADRALAARIALDVFHRHAGTVALAELDRRIRNGLTAAEALRRGGNGAVWDDVVTGALGFLSWRARVEDRPVDWADNARRNLRAAAEESAATPRSRASGMGPSARAQSSARLRGAGRDRPRDRPVDRVERAVMNLIGLPVLPAGPGDPTEYAAASPAVLGELESALAGLAAGSPARLAARIHLLAAGAPAGPTGPARHKAVRDASRLMTAAARRLSGPALTPVVATFVARFGSEIEFEQLRSLLDQAVASCPGPNSDLLWARHGYPALLAAGRPEAAAARVDDAVGSAEAGGDPLQRVEARFLLSRHLLWTGDVEQARRSIEETAAELAAIGLPEPLPVLRQRRILRTLEGQPGDAVEVAGPGDGRPEGSLELFTSDRIDSVEALFRLAHLGRLDRAAAYLGRLAEPDQLDQLGLDDLALLAAATTLIRDREAARLCYQRLAEAGDRLIVRRDGSVIYGPASTWAGLAARAAGLKDEGRRLLVAGLDEVARCGGAVPSGLLYPGRRFEEVPIELQPKLKRPGAE